MKTKITISIKVFDINSYIFSYNTVTPIILIYIDLINDTDPVTFIKHHFILKEKFFRRYIFPKVDIFLQKR